MQNYTAMGDTSTETVKEALLHHEENINSLRSGNSGTAFPTENLVAGMRCYRTDKGKDYVYDGENWSENARAAEKQDTLTFDDTPTADSTNPVTSGGVCQAIADAFDGFWHIDGDGDTVLVDTPTVSDIFTLDSDGDVVLGG